MSKWIYRKKPKSKGFRENSQFCHEENIVRKKTIRKHKKEYVDKRKHLKECEESIKKKFRLFRKTLTLESQQDYVTSKYQFGTCIRKKVFNTIGEAKASAITVMFKTKKSYYVYKCEMCGFCHITSHPIKGKTYEFVAEYKQKEGKKW